MTNPDLILNANLTVLASKIRALELTLSDEQFSTYKSNLKVASEKAISDFEKQLEPQNHEAFRNQVLRSIS
jgi:hypothetical protein